MLAKQAAEVLRSPLAHCAAAAEAQIAGSGLLNSQSDLKISAQTLNPETLPLQQE